LKKFNINGVEHARCLQCSKLFSIRKDRKAVCIVCKEKLSKVLFQKTEKEKKVKIIDELIKHMNLDIDSILFLYEQYTLNELYIMVKKSKTERLYSLLPTRNRDSRTAIPKVLREMVLERDGNRCVECKDTNRLHLHHIIPYSECREHTFENLITLCIFCHAEKHRDSKEIYRLLTSQLDD
jgi:hypothetical protein